MRNTIIVILGSDGHQFVAEIGKNTTITPVLDDARVMSEEDAGAVLAKMNYARAVPRDIDDYRVEVVGRRRQLDELRRQLPVEAFA